MTRSQGEGRRRASRPGTAATLATAAVLILAACSGDNKPIAATPSAPPSTSTSGVTTTSAPTTTPATQDVAADIVARYKMFWQVRFEANQNPPNPEDPRLAEFSTAPQLDKVRAETRSNLDQGLAIRRPPDSVARSSVKVREVNDATATLQECVVDDGVLYRFTTGEVLDAEVATQSVESTMQLVDGVWRLAEARLVQEWKGVAGCALSGDF